MRDAPRHLGDRISRKQHALHYLRDDVLYLRPVLQHLLAEVVQRAAQATSQVRADLIAQDPQQRNEVTHGGHELIGLLRGLVGVKACFVHHRLVFSCEARHPAAHRHQGVFIDAQHLRVLISPVVRHAAEALADTGEDRRHVAHLPGSIPRLHPQTVQETLSARVTAHESRQALQRILGSLGAGAGLRGCIPQRLNTVDRRPGAL